jgi:hypothetical protein
MRVAPDHLGGDGLDHVGKGEGALLLRHPGVIDDLKQEVAELVLEVDEITACDRVGDLIGLLDGIGRDRREILFQIPWAAGAGRAQRRHDLDQAGDVFGRLHRCKSPWNGRASARKWNAVFGGSRCKNKRPAASARI